MRICTSLRLGVGALLLIAGGFAAAENATTAEPVNAYAGPDSSYPEVARLDAGTPVQVMGCLNDWSWCDARFGQDRGWLYAPDISYNYQGGYVPLYRYAPGLGIPVVAFSVDSYWGSHYRDRPWYAQRTEWVRRGTPHHERPSGPAPSAGPPPREARMDKPHSGSQSDRSVRLSSAEASHPNPGRSEGGRDHAGTTAPEPRSKDHSPAPARTESRSPPQEHSAPQREEQTSHAARQAPAERATPERNTPERGAPARAEEHRSAAPAKKDEHGDHPGPGGISD